MLSLPSQRRKMEDSSDENEAGLWTYHMLSIYAGIEQQIMWVFSPNIEQVRAVFV